MITVTKNSKIKIFILILINALILGFISCDANPFFGMGEETDTQPPIITISDPYNTKFVGANFHVKGTASDDKGLDSITLSVEGTTYSQKVTSNLQNYDIIVDTTTIDDGDYKIKVTAKDKSGKTTSSYVNITLDKTGPAINVYSPELTSDPNITPLSGVIDFVIYPVDKFGISETSTNNKFTLYKKGTTTIIYSTVIVWDSVNNRFTPVTIDTMDYEEQEADLLITFEDNLGNISEFRRKIELKHEVDTPSIYLQSPEENSNIPKWLTISGYATDNREIKKVFWNIKRNDSSFVYSTYREIIPETPRSYFNFSKTVEVDNLPDGGGSLSTGTYYVSVYTIDDVSNISLTKEVKFNVDTTLPIITILDSTTTPLGDTPAVAAYLNSNFDTDIQCATPALDEIKYKITQNLGTLKDTGWNPFGPLSQSGDVYSMTVNINTLKTTHNFTDGLITIVWEARKGTKISNNSRIFYIDQTPPTISILSHNNGDSVNGAVTLSGSAYDAQGLEGAIKVYRPAPFDNTTDATGQTIWSFVLGTDTNLIETLYGVPDDSSSDKTFRVQAQDKAGNKTTVNITLSIDPTKDKPVITLLMPDSSGKKVSGMLSVLAVMSDDDYPAKTMSATLRVYQMPGETLLPSLSKDYSPSSSGFPNLTTNIDTSTLTDGVTYRIKINGTDWHSKQAQEIICDFTVDKNVPVITLTGPANNEYKTNTITFSGTVTDNNLIDSLYLSYLHSDGNNRNIQVTLTPSTPFAPGNYNYTFNCTMSSSGNGSGFVSGNDGIDWGNDEWGNSPHLFTLRATDETGLIGYVYRIINLDNNTPSVTVTQPSAGYIIGYGSSTLDIKGSINDNPPAGSAYSLDLEDYKIMLYKGGAPCDGAVSPGDGGIIKNYGSTANSSGTASSWTTTWTYNTGLVDATDYQLRVWARDNAGHESVVAIVNIEKNANPPFVNSATIVNPKSYYKGAIQIQVDAQDTGSAPANGIDSLDLIINNVVVSSYSPPGNPLTLNYTFTYNTDSTSDGLKEIKVRVRDINTLSTNTKLVGNVIFDNTNPVVSAPQFYTLGYSNPITGYSTYLGFTVKVNDVYSLAGDNPQFKIGTTSGGSEILDWSYFPTITWDGQTRYVATFDNWIDVSSYSSRLYLTIKSTDSAGNQIVNTSYYIDQASGIPTVTLDGATDSFKSDRLDSNPGDGKTEISGTVSVSSQDNIWIRVGVGSEVSVSNYSGGTTFSHLFNNGDLPNDNLKFRVRVSKNGIQKMVEKTFYIDNSPPTVTISSTVTPKTNEGYVSGNDLSGKVIFSGTYLDNYQNRITDKSNIQLQINVDNQGWVNVPTTNIVTNPYPTSWTWTYEYDTETHPDMVKNNISIQVRATDLGANQTTSSSITKNIKPYITELEAINQDSAGNSATRPVYEAKWYSSGVWANHNKRRWTVGQDTRFKIKGYNLKQSSTTPEVYLGTFSMPVVSSTKNEIVVSMESNDTNNKSGNLYVRTGGIDSSTITIYVFKFARIGNNYDTLDAKSFDFSLMSDGKAFFTFTRDHQVPPYYAKPGDGNFSSDDYSTYRIKEATTYNPTAANGYNNGGKVDPAFYSCVELYGNYSYMGTCIDEWTGSPGTVIKWTGINDTVNYHDKETAWTTSGLVNSSINTHKNGWLRIRQTGSGNGYIYYFIYDDDSRAATPTPKVRLSSVTLTGYTGLTQSQFAIVEGTNRPTSHISLALRGTTQHPIMLYYTETNNTLNIAYNTATYTPNTFTKRSLKTGVGKFNSIAINSSNIILTSYQNSSNALEVGSLTDETDTSLSTLTIESNEGVTGVSTSTAMSGANNAAFITYLNNSKLNTTEALRLAYYSGAAFSETNLTNTTYWQYMILPSPVLVNYERTVVKWDGTKPVIAYKGNNYIYIARLIQ